MEARISKSAFAQCSKNIMRSACALLAVSPFIQAVDNNSHQTAAIVTVGILFLGLIAAVVYIRAGKEDA